MLTSYFSTATLYAREQWNSVYAYSTMLHSARLLTDSFDHVRILGTLFFFFHKPFLRINQLEFSQEIIEQI